MHQPRPYGQAGAVTDGDRAALDALVRQLTNLKQLSGLPSFKLVRALPSGATAIAQDMGGVLKVIVQPQREEAAQTEDEDGLATTGIPMMFSGVIDQGVVPRGAGVTLKLSASTINRLARQRITVGAQVTLQRFAVGLPQQCSELKPSGFDDNANLFTQYANLRPTWWSNGMAEVVQIVGGYGRQDFANLPDTPAERAMLVLPQSVIDDITAELGAVRLPGYTGKPPTNGGIRYDYKFTTTHGVGFDSAGKPWLVRVSMAGVYAMPLPLVPATTTAAFRRYVADANDDEMQWALNRFGGLPSGESFPDSTKDFEAWRRAGVIIKLCGTSDFYQHDPWGDAMGWTFNRKGTEGFNTCNGAVAESSIMRSYGYKLHMTLGAAVNNGYVRDKITPGAYDAQVVARYVEGVSALIQDDNATNLAIHYKVRRAGADAIMQRVQHMSSASGNYYNECVYWDNLEMQPIAGHAGSVEQVAVGTVATVRNMGPYVGLFSFLVPDPSKGVCASGSVGSVTDDSTDGATNTIVAGYYVGDALKFIRNTVTPAVRTPGDDSALSGVIIPNPDGPSGTLFKPGVAVGYGSSLRSVETITRPDDFAAPDRLSAYRSTNTVTVYAPDNCTVNNAFVAGAPPPFVYSGAERYWFGYVTYDNVVRFLISARSVVTMPFMDRNSALYASLSEGVDFGHSFERNSYGCRDPYSYTPISVVADEWITDERYNQTPQSELIGGFSPWLPNHVLTSSVVGLTPGQGAGSPPPERTPDPVPNMGHGYIGFSSLSQPLTINDEQPDSSYFGSSYGSTNSMVDRNATKVAAGVCEYASVSGPAGSARRTAQGTCSLADNTKPHHFIGVINN